LTDITLRYANLKSLKQADERKQLRD